MAAKKPRSEAQKAAEKRYEEKRKGTLHRVWTLICYPDSMPPDWEEQLSDLHVPVWVSPLHDSDTWTAQDEKKNPKHKAGTFKKAHRHLVVEYPHAVSKKTFDDDFTFLNGVEGVYVRDRVAMVRYLIHKDDPKKAQYDSADMLVFGGADFDLVNQLSHGAEHETMREMRRYIRENDVRLYNKFVDYCDDCMPEWSSLLDRNCYHIKAYITSRHEELSENVIAESLQYDLDSVRKQNRELRLALNKATGVTCFVCDSPDVVHDMSYVTEDGEPVAIYACAEHGDEFKERKNQIAK